MQLSICKKSCILVHQRTTALFPLYSFYRFHTIKLGGGGNICLVQHPFCAYTIKPFYFYFKYLRCQHHFLKPFKGYRKYKILSVSRKNNKRNQVYGTTTVSAFVSCSTDCYESFMLVYLNYSTKTYPQQ